MDLSHYKNLVPDSPLHRHLEQLLREQNGQATVETICQEVLQLAAPPPPLAATLVEALVEGDPRLHFDGEDIVEWVEPGAEDLWAAARRFAVVDVESTNGGRGEQRVIEVGVTLVEDGKVAREWSSLVNPERRIPYWVQQLTSINDAAVAASPRFAELVPALLEQFEDAVLVAHHARFDVACINSEFSRALGKRLTNPYLCTVEVSRRHLPGAENYRLETLSQWLRLTHERPHRAGSDARATAELFCHLLGSTEAPWPDFLRPRGPRAPKLAETKP